MKTPRSAPGGGSRAGFVALVGWTNVGKSTLLNRLLGTKIAAVAEVAQTTEQVVQLVRVPGAVVLGKVLQLGLELGHQEIRRAVHLA